MPLILSFPGLFLTLLLWYLAEYVAEHTWVTTLFAYAPPALLALPTVLFLLIAVIARDLRAILVNAAAGLFVLFAVLGWRWPLAPALPANLPRLRVMTYNIEHGAEGIDGLVREIRKEDPDVVCLQECNGYQQYRAPYPLLRQALPDYHFSPTNETVIATRLPVVHEETVPLLSEGGRVIVKMETVVQGRPVTILNLHFMTAATAETLTHHKGSMPAYLRKTAAIRAEQTEQVLAQARQVSTPIIVCGDFNTPPRGLYYRRLAEAFTDAFAARGTGFGWTFPAHLPCLCIDHIFTGQGAIPDRVHVPVTRASDHRPIVADIALADETLTADRLNANHQ